MDKLVIIEGQAKGTSFALRDDVVSIGRTRECAVRLPEQDVSRVHAKVVRQGGAWVISDVSKNGIKVNGEITPSRRLEAGDTIQIGACKLRFEVEGSPTALGGAAPTLTSEGIAQLRAARDAILAEVGKVVIGQREVVEQILVALFARGHCLLMGVPGLAKTLLVRTLAQAVDLEFKRVQFTPDLMPSDITGTEVLDQDPDTQERVFRFVRGPIFANVLLADEINRTPPKTQAALLEAMGENRVTAGGVTYPLRQPFFVLATQNPIEQEGTYPLPEAQLDRFMFLLEMDYPDRLEEIAVIRSTTQEETRPVERVLTGEQIVALQTLVRKVPVSDYVMAYATDLVRATRPKTDQAPKLVNDYVTWGAGTRAAQYLVLGAKTRALLDGRVNVSCADVRAVALPVLRHRVFTNFNADAEGLTSDKIIEKLVALVKEPEARDLPRELAKAGA
jgi:MoxR-like ATPase